MTRPGRAKYENPLVERYASAQMSENFSPQRRHGVWRRLWLALAEAQRDLGLPISARQIAQMRKHLDDIDFAAVTRYEERFRHDVVAHVHAFADAAPAARPIIHLGATSCFVTDNADLILVRDGLEILLAKLVNLIEALARFAEEHRGLVTLAFTHFQPAQPTTVGKRACLWLYDFVLDYQEVRRLVAELPFRSAKGTTGTQASFLALFDGDHSKVRRLERLVAQKMGFRRLVPVCGQTYSRKLDSLVLNALFIRRKALDRQPSLFVDDQKVRELHRLWDLDANRERRTRTRFAQRALKPAEVKRELEAVDSVLGDPAAVREFVLEACRRLKADPETNPIPVILLTAKGREVDRRMGMEVGADDYIVKPFSPNKLIEKIGSFLSV